jgi:KDO2-lipid IV(A) lauroyltransferase
VQSPTSNPLTQLLGPKYWPSWFIAGMMWLITRLPYSIQLQIGALLGRLLWILARRKRHIATVNVALTFPNMSAEEQKKLLKANFRSTGIAFIEMGLAWWGNEALLKRLTHIEGLEYIQQAQQEGKGVILLGGHFTALIISGRLLSAQLPFNIVVKKLHDKVFETLMTRNRRKCFQGIIDTTDMRGLVRSLRSKHVCWYAPDQDFGNRQSVFVPFMGIQTVTLTTTARLAKTTGAAVVYIDYERLPGTEGYKLTLHPPLKDFPSGDDYKDARRVNELIEQQIHKVPDQYLWVHRRFKTRPPGEPGFYGYADTSRNKRVARELAESKKQQSENK